MFFAVRLERGGPWEWSRDLREQEGWDEHARFMDGLFEADTVVLGGPFADVSGSMVILRAESAEAARAILREDPWARQDVLVAGEVKEWTIFLDARDKAQGWNATSGTEERGWWSVERRAGGRGQEP